MYFFDFRHFIREKHTSRTDFAEKREVFTVVISLRPRYGPVTERYRVPRTASASGKYRRQSPPHYSGTTTDRKRDCLRLDATYPSLDGKVRT